MIPEACAMGFASGEDAETSYKRHHEKINEHKRKNSGNNTENT